MYATSYDIIDWKSCESYSQSASAEVSRDIASGTEIIFPKLFHEQNSETSIFSSNPDFEQPGGPLQFYNAEFNSDQVMDQQSVYQKVANWVLTQRNYFRNVELQQMNDDDIEVIDPVDLFHESILNDYQLITENDSERRELLRDFESYRYHMESIEQAMLLDDYRFLRRPKSNIDLELTPIVDFHTLYKNNTRKKRRNSSSTTSSYVEQVEERLDFLGVPRLLENYVILNREGYVIDTISDRDIWLEPLNELSTEEQNKSEIEELDLDFISSWFSDVYQTDINTDEVRTLITVNTDIFEKVTVISLSHPSDDIWVDAPDIPHWLDDEYEELELFNQPSRPLYYYRDRIKGCYRIIGVEDETVVLFSGNDDDTIFYPGECDDFEGTNQLRSWDEMQCEEERRFVGTDSDRKYDSGIEDDIMAEDVAIASVSVSKKSANKLVQRDMQKTTKRVTFREDVDENVTVLRDANTSSFIETLFVVLGAACVLMAVLSAVQPQNKVRIYKSESESLNNIKKLLHNLFNEL